MTDRHTVSREGFYPLGDEIYRHPPRTRAKWTGEKRPPRAGEWYLSGAIVAAYRAPNDLSTPYHIATLVETRTITTEVEI